MQENRIKVSKTKKSKYKKYLLLKIDTVLKKISDIIYIKYDFIRTLIFILKLFHIKNL